MRIWFARGSERALFVTVTGAALLLSACAGPPEPAPTSSAPTSAAAPCPQGTGNEPPTITDLRLESGTASVDPASLPELVVPFTASSAVGPSLLRISVATSTIGSPVTFSTTAGHIVERASESWLAAPAAITVFSAVAEDGSCRAVAYLAVTRAGRARITVSALNTLTFPARVITVPEAARTVTMTLPRGRVLAGARISGGLTVRDGFGNPVLGMPLTVTVDGPGRILPRGTTVTVSTDVRGRATFELGTSKEADGDLTVTAQSDWGGCVTSASDGAASGMAQVECPADVPVPGFTAGVRTVIGTIEIVNPNAAVVEPVADTALTQGETFEVVARTEGIPVGARAVLELGGEVAAEATVEAAAEGSVEGSVRLSTVAALDPLGGGYRLLVEGAEPVALQVAVRPFTITLVTRDADQLVLEALPGSLAPGTAIRLLRGETDVAVGVVDIPGAPVAFRVPIASGTYNVAATLPDGEEVLGADPQRIRR